MKGLKVCALALGCTALLLMGLAMAQEDPLEDRGLKPYAAYHGGDLDSINLSNGSLTLHIPLWSFPGRGGQLNADYFISFTSNPWIIRTLTVGGEPRDQWAFIGNCEQDNVVTCAVGGIKVKNDKRLDYFYKLVEYAPHLTDYSFTAVEPSGAKVQMAKIGSNTYRSLDGSGLYLDVSAGLNTGTIRDRNGTYSIGSNLYDPNGNYVVSAQNSLGLTDTLNRTLAAPVSTTDPQDLQKCDSTPLPLNFADVWSLPAPTDASGQSTARIIFCHVSGHVYKPDMDWGGGGVDAYKGFIQNIVLPNGTKWKFEYDTDGNLTKLTVPTGGSISYAWGNTDGCSETFAKAVSSRTVDSGDGSPAQTWTYSEGALTTVTDPQGNETLHTFAGGSGCPTYETQVQVYQGSHTSGTLLKTVQTQYAVFTNPYDLMRPLYFPTTVTTIWPNGGSTVQSKIVGNVDGTSLEGKFNFGSLGAIGYAYETRYGNVFNKKEYDNGTNAPGSLVRETVNTYKFTSDSNYKNNNLLDLPGSIQVKNASGSQIAYTTYGYDEAAYPLQPSGITTQHTTPPNSYRGNQTSVNRWLNTTGTNLSSNTQFYDTGTVFKATDPGRHVTQYTYSSTFAGAYPTQVQLPDTHAPDLAQHIRQTNYDFNSGVVLSTTDENTRVTSYLYDLLSRPRRITYPSPNGGQVDYTFDDSLPSSNSPSVTIQQKITSTVDSTKMFVVDGLGRLRQSRHTSDPENTVYVDTTYDALGRKASVTNPYRNPTGESTNGTTQYTYDTLGRIRIVTEPDGRPVTTDYLANCTTVTDEAGKKRKSCIDGLGRLTQVYEDPTGLNYLTSYQYDTLGNLACAEQHGTAASASGCSGSSDVGSLWRVRRFTYDSLSRLLTAKNPETGTSTSYGTISYTYDADGNVLTKTAPAANQSGSTMTATTYAYDEIHRLKSKSYSGGPSTPSVLYAYDAGTLTGCTTAPPVPSPVDANPKPYRTSMCDAGGASSWTHDEMGRVLKDRRINVGTSSPTKTFTYTYNYDGSTKTLQYPSGRTITYTVGGAGRMLSAQDIANGINYVTGATYAPQGALSGFVNHATIKAGFSYNSRLQPIQIDYTAGNLPSGNALYQESCPGNVGTIMHRVYHFGVGVNDNGNVLSIDNCKVTNRTGNYTYDNLNRITSGYSTGPQWGNTYVIDAWGNLTNKNAISGKAAEMLAATATWKNQLSGVSHTYDAAGNLTNDGTHGFTYDAENRMVTVSGTPNWTYVYDGDGRRVKKCSSCTTASGGTMYYQGTGAENMVESNLGGTVTFEYVFFNGKRVARRDTSTNPPNYYFTDHLGSINVLTDSTGVVKNDCDYYAYGGEVCYTATITQPYKFTGKERDTETALDYFGARYYGSNMGRFLSPDWSEAPEPVPYADLTTPQTLNLYQYVGNNPLATADADGHCWPPSACADVVDSWVQNFRQDGLAANNLTSSSSLVFLNTFANGVTADLASGAADVLRLGNGTAAAIDSAKQGDYAGAAIGLAQDGGRAAGIILAVTAVAPGANGAAPSAESAKPVGNDLGLSSTTKTSASGKTTTTVADPAGSTTYKTTPGKTGGQATYIVRKDAQGNVKYVKQEARTNNRDFTKPPDHIHYKKPIDKEVK